jgi:acyl carrier protein
MSDPHVIRDQISRLFSDVLHRPVQSADDDLFETGVLDSLAFVDLLAELERRFGLTIALDDLEVEHFRSVARIAEFVAARALFPERGRVVRFARTSF